jgi:formylglycine-generating enzyme required for sulfatase activity
VHRLLSEAEWEYAAGAGATLRYFFGYDDKDMCRIRSYPDRRRPCDMDFRRDGPLHGLMHRSKTVHHSNTSSARASKDGGIVTRSAFAVF